MEEISPMRMSKQLNKLINELHFPIRAIHPPHSTATYAYIIAVEESGISIVTIQINTYWQQEDLKPQGKKCFMFFRE